MVGGVGALRAGSDRDHRAEIVGRVNAGAGLSKGYGRLGRLYARARALKVFEFQYQRLFLPVVVCMAGNKFRLFLDRDGKGNLLIGLK